MASKAKKGPDSTSAAHELMAPRIRLMNVLMEGTDALRAAAEEFLPRYEMETELNYQARLNRAVLVNYFRRTVLSLVGKPFSKPIVLEDSMPPQLKELSLNIDRQGNNIDVFARRAFQEALSKGLCHILVEYPNTAQAGVVTIADEQAINANPYFVLIPPEAILAAYAETQNGEEVLTHVRIYEEETVRQGFDEVIKQRVRILEVGKWELWEKRDKDRWAMIESGVTSLGFIPLVTYYTEREDFMVARPPLTDLAHVNISHYQSNADQENILSVARFPMLAGSGLNEEEAAIKIGPRQLLTCIAKDGKYYYVEHSGSAIAAGREDMKSKEEQMSILGIELLKKTGDATATAKAIDTAENLSMLQALTLMFQDALEQAYQIAADWIGLDTGGSLKVNSDFGLLLDNGDLVALQAARASGDISREAFLAELIRRGILSDDFDVEGDAALIDAEAEKAMQDAVLQQQLMQPTVPAVAAA